MGASLPPKEANLFKLIVGIRARLKFGALESVFIGFSAFLPLLQPPRDAGSLN
ncbi:hypothetical protein Fmac_012546 [Flemingia macrophylla]|uniref:Uncharacterized protein n=1 Tax=Flemingia macrophylla TaxID=520843 RepID=A0ABD1MQK6_9FABA